MSHFSTLKTALVDKRLLLKALDELGIEYEEGDLGVKGFEGTTRCEIRIPTDQEEYDIGFRLNGTSYEMVGDFNMMGDFDREDFLGALTQRYAFCAVHDQLGADFQVVEEHQESDNTIHVLLRKMA
jgi:hypothetical protein